MFNLDYDSGVGEAQEELDSNKLLVGTETDPKLDRKNLVYENLISKILKEKTERRRDRTELGDTSTPHTNT